MQFVKTFPEVLIVRVNMDTLVMEHTVVVRNNTKLFLIIINQVAEFTLFISVLTIFEISSWIKKQEMLSQRFLVKEKDSRSIKQRTKNISKILRKLCGKIKEFRA
jgi:hypothetical protein